jgi:signal transduction histidine kinase
VDDSEWNEGRAPLRDRLEQAAVSVRGAVAVSVTTVGGIVLPAPHVRELSAAVEQALANVVDHADADHAWVYAESVDGEVVVSVRDDGRGFVFDEAALHAAGKFGVLRSICGRTRDLGGHAHVETAPGRGTEIELRVPVGDSAAREADARG